MWSIYAVAGLVLLAVALYKLWQRSSSPQYARIVNGYSVSPAKLIMDDDDESVDMDELVFRPNPVERLELSNCLGRRGVIRRGEVAWCL